MSEAIIGIDLGTTQSAVGVVDSGFPILLADEEGRALVPSAVWFGPGGEVELGHTALRRGESAGVLTSVKSFMGRRFHELDPDQQERVTEVETGVEFQTVQGGKTPEEVSAEVLKRVKRVAEERLEEEVRKAVITVPAYFNDAQRSATKVAGELAGLEVVRILSEPTAAALAYGLDRLEETARVAVFDLGGGTFDVSVLEMRAGVYEVLATAGDTRLGGDDFDRSLMQLVAEKAAVTVEDEGVWLSEARRVKHLLASDGAETAMFRLPFICEVEVTRGIFEEMMEPFLKRMEKACCLALSDAGLEVGALAAVVMVGGSSRIPIVRERVKALFQREPDLGQHPDEAIARGAAIQAGVLSGVVREVLLLDVTPLSLGLETMGGLMNVLIARNTTIPCKAGEMFTNAVDGQKAMELVVLQGERELAKDNWELGRYQVPFEATQRGQARVGVEFRIDADGILTVLARDTETGQDTLLEVGSAAVDVSESRVEQMVSESVEHAFEDMSARVFHEARLKAEEMLPAVEQALSGMKDHLEEEEILKIRARKQAVEEAISKESGALLKKAVEELDDATEAMAALLVERAMAALFVEPQD